ncbi:hypothetical protein V2T44_02350 [Serratia ficaria]|uniref:hypothetical protein n=1 Tax=Serratia TaxID=613 RepID=UPI001013D2B0|nr:MULTISPECIES: hypothetical protein [Serratia]MEE4481807.1 hypothetical protein [Serratia ficaria]
MTFPQSNKTCVQNSGKNFISSGASPIGGSGCAGARIAMSRTAGRLRRLRMAPRLRGCFSGKIGDEIR